VRAALYVVAAVTSLGAALVCSLTIVTQIERMSYPWLLAFSFLVAANFVAFLWNWHKALK